MLLRKKVVKCGADNMFPFFVNNGVDVISIAIGTSIYI